MENQIEKPLNVKGLILLIGTVMGAVISFLINGTLGSIFTGLIGGLIFAIFFNTVLLPQKPHDR